MNFGGDRTPYYMTHPKACYSSREKKTPKREGARTQPCFTPLLMSHGSDIPPSYWMVTFISSWKDLIMLCNLGGQPIFRRTLNSPSLMTRSNALVRSMKAT